VDEVFEANFQKYLQVLTEKGYFNNVAVGSPEYNSRVQKAREKLEENEKANEVKAEQKKLEGNNFVSSKQYNEAIQAYTEAISLCPRNPIYYANRYKTYIHSLT
jgi:tetratricopeptide (TPR) repeat protein